MLPTEPSRLQRAKEGGQDRVARSADADERVGEGFRARPRAGGEEREL
jgi:hypothetical protein